MSRDYFFCRLLELIGVRHLSLFSARLFNQPHPPKVRQAKTFAKWSRGDLIAFRQDARFTLIANFIRAALTFPLVLATGQYGSSWVYTVTLGVFVLHILIVLAEGYRLSLAREIERHATDLAATSSGRQSQAITFKTRGYFRPRQFEKFYYRILGLEAFRRIVVHFIETTKLSRQDKAKGEEVHFVDHAGRPELYHFEASTRMAEAIHLICALWDFPALALLVAARSPWLVFAAFLFVLDLYLVLLQRYHRVRVWAIINTERNHKSHPPAEPEPNPELGPETGHAQA